MTRIIKYTFLYLFIIMISHVSQAVEHIDLSGKWQIRLDRSNVGEEEKWFLESFENCIRLPGSTAEGGYGDMPSDDYLKECVQGLDPRYGGPVPNFVYEGCVWYQKEVDIPVDWDHQQISLFLERVRWKSDVWVNGYYIGSDDSLSTPHVWDISNALHRGINRLVVRVDNSKLFDLGPINSGTSLHTQGMWNGIIGKMELRKKSLISIDDLQVYPNLENNSVFISSIIHNKSGKKSDGEILLKVVSPEGEAVAQIDLSLTLEGEESKIEAEIPLGKSIKNWDEFNPVRYRLEARVQSQNYTDSKIVFFGMREVAQDGTNILVNGKKVYLRGTLECANFPLTGYPSMTLEAWLKIMGVCKANGLNHIRFHSWTPPEAAFEAADLLGIYILTEATRANSGVDKDRDAWVEEEMLRIQKCYANHPSFALFTSGNELKESLYKTGEAFVERMKASDNRHLHSFGSGGLGMDMLENDISNEEFFVYGIRGHALTRGRMSKGNAHEYYEHIHTPTTDHDLDEFFEDKDIPVISHEIGQWCVFPSMEEIGKYTGAMNPVNLKFVRSGLKEKGLYDQAADFTRVTAKHAALLYKEEIETLLRSKKSGGFQLLQLNDYSGQGTAHCGLYDAFWDSKRAISEEGFRQFSGAITPLLRLSKFVWVVGDTFVAKAEVRNNGNQALIDVTPYWRILDDTGKVIDSGIWSEMTIAQGCVSDLGEIRMLLDKASFAKAQKLKVEVGFKEDSNILNSWDVWVYPASIEEEQSGGLLVIDTLTPETYEVLSNGAKVLLLAKPEDLQHTIRGRFLAPFWSPVHWWTRDHRGNVSMSILCDPEHLALEKFPTEEHTNWQWAELLDTSYSIVLDDLPKTLQPIIQVVDNFGRNHKLGSLIEVKVGSGRLIICGLDLIRDLENRPVARQMKHSLLEYMNSEEFQPRQQLSLEELKKVVSL